LKLLIYDFGEIDVAEEPMVQKVVVTKLSVQKYSQESAMPVSKKEISPCPIDAMLSVIDGRWKGTILWKLLDGPMRTNELRRSIPEITERMLIRHLQELVRDGILERHEETRVPPCVRYNISEYGMTMVPVLEAICAWGRLHLEAANLNMK
jgi:DNA-binding HxlR family transcriptional regulator